MKKLITLSLFLIFFTSLLDAQEDKRTTPTKDIYDLDIEELLNVKAKIATKSEQSVEQAPSVVSVITAKEIKDMGARELVDVLQMVPGFEISKTLAGQNLIGVRGVKDPRMPCKLLILVDGKPVNGIFYGDADYDGYKFDMDNIDRIEIIRGPGSPLYGRNAFSAIINIISKTGKTEKGISAKTELGTFNTYTGHLAYGYDNKDFNLHLSSYFIKSDGSNAYYREGDPNHSSSDKWAIDHNNQIFNADLSYKEIHVSGTFAIEKLGQWQHSNEVRRIGGNYMIEYNHPVNEKFRVKAKFYGQNKDHVEDIEIAKPSADAPLGLYVTPKLKEYLYGLELEANIKLYEGNDLFLGVQGDIHGVKDVLIWSNFDLNDGTPIPNIGHNNQVLYAPGWFTNNGHDYNNLGLYIQDIFHPADKVDVTIGARYDRESQIGGVFNPRLGIVYNIMPQTYLKVMYGEAFRSPAPSQQYQTSGFANGEPNLQPEKIKSLEVSLSHRTKNMINQVNLFRNQINNMIYAETFISADLSNIAPNRNMGKNIATGIEFENKIFITKNISSFLNYSFTVSKNTDNLQDSTERTYDHVDVSPHKLNAGVNIAFLKYFNLNATAMYRSSMSKFTSYNTDSKTFTEISKDRVGDYTIFNATLRFSHLIQGLELSASAYNIFDTKYYSQESSTPYVPQQGNRQVIFRLSYSF